ncbi:hypothetical protein NDU88_001317 [Pleurodeles waltl]|uniref:Uncharacterized protein n=1 Tax=Pleurodeles waltl TaxID=8319 RepID=A0AAV7LFJ5_PLEWA|nr:hypothetical protein NDU88_001317 [Pleurodeles waltl]
MRVRIRASETPGAKSSRKREFTSRNNKDDRLPMCWVLSLFVCRVLEGFENLLSRLDIQQRTVGSENGWDERRCRRHFAVLH